MLFELACCSPAVDFMEVIATLPNRHNSVAFFSRKHIRRKLVQTVVAVVAERNSAHKFLFISLATFGVTDLTACYSQLWSGK